LLDDGVTAPSPEGSLSQLSTEVYEDENRGELHFLQTIEKVLGFLNIRTKTESCGVASYVVAGEEIEYLRQTLLGEL